MVHELLKEEDIRTVANKKHIPLSATIELTYACNAACKHCYIHKRKMEELSFEEVVSVIDQLVAAGTLYLKLTGGEPLLRKDFFDIAAYARKRSFALDICTNATLITRKIAEEISRLSPRIVKVSLYGPTANAYGEITGKPELFRGCINGIRMLVEKRVPCLVSIIIFNHNTIGQIAKMIKFVKNLGVRLETSISFAPRANGDLTPITYNPSESQLKKIFRYLPEARDILYTKNNRDSTTPGNGILCKNAGSVVNIDPYGHIGICALARSEETVRNKSVLEIWKNDPLLCSFRAVRWKSLLKCRDCNNSFCSPCPAQNKQFTGSMVKVPEFTCEWNKMIGRLSQECFF